MKRLKALAGCAGICGIALVGVPQTAAAEDWIVPGLACVGVDGARLDRAEQLVTFMTAPETTATCPLTKTFGADNLEKVWIRWQRRSGAPSEAWCRVTTSTNLGEYSYGYTELPANTAPQYTSLNLPAEIQNRGHLGVDCTAQPGFEILGIRYQQN